MSDAQEPEIEKLTRKKKERRRRKPIVWILWICFAVSAAALIIYLLDIDYSDDTLFLLLNIMWYSSFLVCVCAFYRFLESLYYFFKRRRSSRSLRIIPSLLFMIYGLTVIFLESLMVAFSKGNL